MTSVLQSLSENYNDWRIGANPEVDSWFLMDAPGAVIGIVMAYLVIILKIGPDFMKNRKPMELKRTLIAYNAFQVLFSIYLVLKIRNAEIPLSSMFSPTCSNKFAMGDQKKLFLEGTWWYFLAKITELWDTFFFILRKKMNQVSFLHIYHHSTMVLFTWLFLKYTPSPQATIVGFINSGVHVIMYFYYMVSAMGPAYQKYIWWKKYITMLQLGQFCIVILYMFMTIFADCGFSKTVTYLFILNGLFFLHLFSDFYRKSYKKSSKVKSDDKRDDSKNGILLKSSMLGDENNVYPKISEKLAMTNEELRKRQ